MTQLSCQFPVWKTITITSGRLTAQGIRLSLESRKNLVSKDAFDVCTVLEAYVNNGFSHIRRTHAMDLAKVTVRDLGFPEGANRCDVYDRAFELGLHRCWFEDGPQLCAQHPLAFSKGEKLTVCTTPVPMPNMYVRLFAIRCRGDGSGVVVLDDSDGAKNKFWSPEHVCIFRRPTQVYQTSYDVDAVAKASPNSRGFGS